MLVGVELIAGDMLNLTSPILSHPIDIHSTLAIIPQLVTQNTSSLFLTSFRIYSAYKRM